MMKPAMNAAQMGDAVTVAILAGGHSRRMGIDKSFVLLDGKPLIEHVVERVSALKLGVILITNAPGKYSQFDHPMYRDVIPECGALGGLYTALHHAPTEYVLCVACDMPFLNPPLLQFLLDLREGFQAVVPIIGDKPEGLHAVYHRSCLDVIERQISAGSLRLIDLYPHLHSLFLHDAQICLIDPKLRSFTNLNTPEGLRQAQHTLPTPLA